MQGEVGTPMIKHEKTLHVDICSCHRCSGRYLQPVHKKINSYQLCSSSQMGMENNQLVVIYCDITQLLYTFIYFYDFMFLLNPMFVGTTPSYFWHHHQPAKQCHRQLRFPALENRNQKGDPPGHRSSEGSKKPARCIPPKITTSCESTQYQTPSKAHV